MSWWNRSKQPSTPASANPATDETSLDRCVRRLQEILDELGPIGQFLEAAGERMTPGPDLENRLAGEVERLRVPGFCAYKLTLEAWTLMELIAVRVIALRKLCAQTGRKDKPGKLDAIQAVTEQVEPMLRETLAQMEVYSSLDGKAQLEAMAKRLQKQGDKQ